MGRIVTVKIVTYRPAKWAYSEDADIPVIKAKGGNIERARGDEMMVEAAMKRLFAAPLLIRRARIYNTQNVAHRPSAAYRRARAPALANISLIAPPKELLQALETVVMLQRLVGDNALRSKWLITSPAYLAAGKQARIANTAKC